MLRRAITFIDGVSRLGAYYVAVVIILALAMILVEIVARSVFGTTIYIANEYAGYAMASISFMGLAFTLSHSAHIRMTFIDNIFRGRGKILFDILLCLAGLLVSAYFVGQCSVKWYDCLVAQTRSMQITRTLIAYPMTALVLGSAMLFLQFVGEILKNIVRYRENDAGKRDSSEFI